MANFELIMPKLGESIIEATITKWLKKPGDTVEEDDSIVEIATDKVDSEIPSPVDGKIKELFFDEGDVVEVGKIIALIEMEGDEEDSVEESLKDDSGDDAKETNKGNAEEEVTSLGESQDSEEYVSERFFSPLVRSIAGKEGISLNELDSIEGSGKDGRLTKRDLFKYLDERKKKDKEVKPKEAGPVSSAQPQKTEKPDVASMEGDTIIEMDRMRRLIADHMVMSKQLSPHVTSFIEVDMTAIVNWRNKVKADFQKREGEKITFTPIFMEAVAKALKDYPGVNASVDGYNIIHRKHVNIGMATALPNGNLIVPVIKDADQKNLRGLAKDVNGLASRARNNKLQPDEIQGGTFTITNFGTFSSLTGNPIINQPQVAILGVGLIKKRPVVIETAEGDMIGIRHISILSLSYDHRVVDGALGGMFLKKVADYLENFDTSQSI